MDTVFTLRLDKATAKTLTRLAKEMRRSKANTLRWLINCAAKKSHSSFFTDK